MRETVHPATLPGWLVELAVVRYRVHLIDFRIIDNHSHFRSLARLLTVVVGALLLGAACSQANTSQDDRISVVATTTILGDVAASIVGDHGDVTVLMPVGADPHEYQPSSKQVSQMAKASLVVANGLGLEQGLAPALESVVSDGGNVLYVGGSAECQQESCDPHIWLDPVEMQSATEEIAMALTRVKNTIDWRRRSEVYRTSLEGLIVAMETEFEVVLASQRLLITNHDSLGYLADRFGFEIVGSVIPGGATLAEPSSSHLAELVALINRTGIGVIFSETTEVSVLADAVASGADHHVDVVDLYVGSLGPPDSDAATYIGMMLENARLMTTSLIG
jgi:zinc/manganese transport system substrate-binding protein